jgi:hypothetical protein
MGTVFKVNEWVYQQSIIEGLSLATPALANISYQAHNAPTATPDKNALEPANPHHNPPSSVKDA